MPLGPEPEVVALSEFLGHLNKETDRGAALIAASFIDQRLRDVLTAFMVKDANLDELFEGPTAALGSFSAKATAAFALGLIQENEFREINVVRKIRNEFGHKWRDVDFEKGKVGDLVDQLHWLGPPLLEAGAKRRDRFDFAVSILIVDLMWRVELVVRERRVSKTWPHKARV